MIDHLQSRGLIPNAHSAFVQTLGGGVSNRTFLVVSGDQRLVVKQAMGQLRVKRDWFADPARTVSEGRALRLAASVDARRVPHVIDLDEERKVLVLAAAPDDARDWKGLLLSGNIDSRIAECVGTFLARLHTATRDPALLTAFDAWEAFEQLRVRPYFQTLVEDDPHLGRYVLPVIERMSSQRVCLVHGDVSPKNVLVGRELCWLIDFEVAHAGDPTFDTAFMICHLAIKAIHSPDHKVELFHAADVFLSAYLDADGLATNGDHLVALVGCLLMARVRGRSPAEYLNDKERAIVWEAGVSLASNPPRSIGDAFVQLGRRIP